MENSKFVFLSRLRYENKNCSYKKPKLFLRRYLHCAVFTTKYPVYKKRKNNKYHSVTVPKPLFLNVF